MVNGNPGFMMRDVIVFHGSLSFVSRRDSLREECEFSGGGCISFLGGEDEGMRTHALWLTIRSRDEIAYAIYPTLMSWMFAPRTWRDCQLVIPGDSV